MVHIKTEKHVNVQRLGAPPPSADNEGEEDTLPALIIDRGVVLTWWQRWDQQRPQTSDQ